MKYSVLVGKRWHPAFRSGGMIFWKPGPIAARACRADWAGLSISAFERRVREGRARIEADPSDGMVTTTDPQVAENWPMIARAERRGRVAR